MDEETESSSKEPAFVPPPGRESHRWLADFSVTPVGEKARLTSEDFVLCGLKWCVPALILLRQGTQGSLPRARRRLFCYPQGNQSHSHVSLYLEAVPESCMPRRCGFRLSVVGQSAEKSMKGASTTLPPSPAQRALTRRPPLPSHS